MSLVDDLRDLNDDARLQAAHAAHLADEDEEPGLVQVLLEVALTDDTEVRTGFGLNDDTEHIGDTAASSLERVLRARDGIDPRVRAAVTDPEADDDRVARLLYYLGPRYEPLRRELAASPEGRLRLRALKADPDRSVEQSISWLSDPAPAVRAEAVLRMPEGTDVEVLPGVLATDPAAEVRRAAAWRLALTPVGSAPLLAALRVETDLLTKAALLSGLRRCLQEPDVLPALVGLLADEPLMQRWTSIALHDLADAGVAAAFASRILVEDDYQVLSSMLSYQHLMTYVPELRGLLERLLRHTDREGHVFYLTRALGKPDGRPVALDPAAGLSPGQRARLLREVVGWAVAALEPHSPGEVADLNRPSPAGDCLRAAASNNLREAMDAGVRVAVAAAGRDPAAGWAAELTRLAHLVTAAQIRAGLEPLPPGPLRHLFLEGEPLVVHLSGGGWVPLELGGSAPLAAGVRPERAGLRAPCPACGIQRPVAAALTWQYRDDDRYAESEDGFAGVLTGTCPVCRTPGRADVRLSLTRSRADDTGQLTWDAIEQVY